MHGDRATPRADAAVDEAERPGEVVREAQARSNSSIGRRPRGGRLPCSRRLPCSLTAADERQDHPSRRAPAVHPRTPSDLPSSLVPSLGWQRTETSHRGDRAIASRGTRVLQHGRRRISGWRSLRTTWSRPRSGCVIRVLPRCGVLGQGGRLDAVRCFLLHHRHEPDECGVVFASFRGRESSLRRRATIASCRTGGHAIWWQVEAASEDDALALLPFFVAARTTATKVSEVTIP